MIAVWAGLAMFFKDLLGSLIVVLESRNRPFWASQIGALADWASLAMYGIGITVVYENGWSWVSAALLFALYVGTTCGTISGTMIGNRFKDEGT